MFEMTTRQTRSRLELKTNPDWILGERLGPAFLSYRRRFKRIERRLENRPPAPMHLDIDVTTVCQLACPMCPASLDGAENPFPGFGLFMDEEIYFEVLKQAQNKGVPSLRLGVTGEPLLVPDLDQWVFAAKEAGFLDVALVTNGQLLDEKTSERLVKAGLTRLMISVDAASAAVYERVRPGGDFERLLGNIETFLNVRQDLGGPLPLLRLSFVVMGSNRAEMDAFREKFAGSADYLAFQDYLRIVGPTTQALRTDEDHLETKPFSCPDPLTRLAIYADGSMFPCCSDFGRLEPVGSLWDMSLEQAWNSPRALKLAQPEGRNCLSCRKCREASRNDAAESLSGDDEEADPENPWPLPLKALEELGQEARRFGAR
ncbi:MAG: radical SAM protein [Deltaproteobacteria bacterium]|jgi:radical SAM protein with 4Fe4S-binding SPASM domain|nr:radical SAM protein [Deltaproteobacteria bacterium]